MDYWLKTCDLTRLWPSVQFLGHSAWSVGVLTRGHVTGLNEPKLNFFFHFSLISISVLYVDQDQSVVSQSNG
ncbi:hypothetical protein T07_4395 [Trichinella nelsoni]|uniref:Uncharacterized protein n=1 Tax=Trichinella nelsoni TaxID=6336 RepID=A0A0V0S268_9BILA|nr:hypothetical protein T07_4395 [Trichinella nelsoni]